MARRRQYEMAPENDEAAMWLATEATATAGVMPMNRSWPDCWLVCRLLPGSVR
jgi:hypothetical protein